MVQNGRKKIKTDPTRCGKYTENIHRKYVGKGKICCEKIRKTLGICAKYVQNMRNVCFWPKKSENFVKYAECTQNVPSECPPLHNPHSPWRRLVPAHPLTVLPSSQGIPFGSPMCPARAALDPCTCVPAAPTRSKGEGARHRGRSRGGGSAVHTGRGGYNTVFRCWALSGVRGVMHFFLQQCRVRMDWIMRLDSGRVGW